MRFPKFTVKRAIIFFLALAYFATLAIARSDPDFGSPRQNPELSWRSQRFVKDGIVLLDLKEKDPYSNGYFEGLALSWSIRQLVSDFQEIALVNDKYFGRPWYSYAAYRSKAYLPFVPKEALEEMRWISDGAGIPFVDVLLINVYDDAANNLWCSSVVVPASGTGSSFFHARNLDYPLPFLAKTKVVTKYPDRVTFGFPWYVGVLTGLNSRWITLSSHTVKSSEPTVLWIPTGLLYRKILEESTDMATAKSVLESSVRTMGNNLAIGSARENLAAVAEFDSEAVAYKSPSADKGFVASTNHFSTPEMTGRNVHGIPASSKMRLDWFGQSYSEGHLATASWAMATMSHFVPDASHAWTSVANAWTVQSVVMHPLENRAFIANWSDTPVTSWWYAEIRWTFD